MAALHFIQGVIVLAVSSDFTRGITQDYLTANVSGDDISLEATSRVLFDVKLVYLIAAFAFMSAIAHTVIATVGNERYNKDLKKGINTFRWIEYSLSASTMMVAISILSGIFGLTELIMIFVLTAIMNLMGLVMEVHNQTTKRVNWLSYYIGVLAGAVPWVVIAIYFWASATGSDTGPPTFVYFIWASIFAFFNCFAINMILQYKKIGKWSDYIYGERVYIWLSLLAKSALIWQVFAGTLQP